MANFCAECGMSIETGEYHPYAACLMFKACHNYETVRANLGAMRRAEPSGLRELVEKWRKEVIGWDIEAKATNDWKVKLARSSFAEIYKNCANELEVALADTEPSVPQPQSKTQYKRLVVQGAIEPSVPVSLLNKFRQQIDSNSYSRETILKKFDELITEARGGSHE